MIRLLTVDDARVVRDFVGMIVQAAPDMEITATAASGSEAMAVLASVPIDVVVVDLGLPDIDGHDLIDLIVCQQRFGLIVLSGTVCPKFEERHPGIVAFDKLELFAQRDAFVDAVRQAALNLPSPSICVCTSPDHPKDGKVSLRR